MATYYVRTTGSNSNNGLSPAAAWQTITKAAGLTGVSSGDTCYIGAGIYRETVIMALTSPTSETKFIGDVDGSHTGDAGEVQVTAYTTNDTTAPSSSSTINLNGKNFLTFQNLLIIGGGGQCVSADTTNITLSKCSLFSGKQGGQTLLSHTSVANTASNWLIDSCSFFAVGTNCIGITLTRPTGADFNYNITINNCLFMCGAATPISITSTGANTFNGGGVNIYNCSLFWGGISIQTLTANLSTTIPCNVYNCFIYGSANPAFQANTSGQIVEDYNVIISSSSPRTNVTAGTHSIANGSYAPLFFTGHEYFSVGSNIRPFGMPKPSSPLLNYGNQSGSPSTDTLGATRPSGSSLPSVGCYELGNGAVKETGTVRTGANSNKIAGVGYREVFIAVNAVSTTISVYARYDSSYAGTLPSMSIVNGGECGVANATATQVGAANTWELLSLIFTPTSTGIITIRLVSVTTAPSGNAFFDDLSIS